MSKRPRDGLRGNIIADTSIRQPVMITMFMLLLIVAGALAYSRMPVNLLPDFEFPVVQVAVPYPGAGPETVADQVARPIEDEVSTLAGVRHVTSSAADGFGVVVIEFRQGVDANQALQDVRERVIAIRGTLPEQISEPVFERFNAAQTPVLALALTSKSGQDSQSLRRLITREIVPAMQRAPGVGSITVTGGDVRQIQVELNLARLQSLQILPGQVSQAIGAAGLNVGLGDVTERGQQIGLRAPSAITSPEAIAQIGIPGTEYTVGDVATIRDGAAEVTALARLNGADTIRLDVRRQSGSNSVAVTDGALAALAAVTAANPDVQYTVVSNDGDAVRLNTLGAIEEIFIALGFAVLVVLYFFSGMRRFLTTAALPALVLLLGIVVLPAFGVAISPLYPIIAAVALLIVQSFFADRNTFITVVGLPVIILGTFAGMAAFGLSINIITLLAISVSVGLVIDDAIVVRENIIHRLELGDAPRQAASRGSAEVALSVLAMTLTIVAVFVPVTFTTGITGIIFQSFGITVAIAMLLSLVEAYTFAPMLSAVLIRRRETVTDTGDAAAAPSSGTGDAAPAMRTDDAVPALGTGEAFAATDVVPGTKSRTANASPLRYARLLGWSLRHRGLTLGAGAVVIALTVALAGQVQTSFLPTQEEHRFGAAFTLPAGTPLAETDAQARRFEQLVQQDPAVAQLLTSVSAGQARFDVILRKDASTDATIARLRPQLAVFPRLILAPTSAENGTSTDVSASPIQLRVRSTDSALIGPAVAQVQAAIADVPGLADMDSTENPGAPELRYALKQRRANEYGVTNADLALTLRTLVQGNTAASYRSGGENVDIVVRLRPEDRQSSARLAQVQLPLGGRLVPVSALADVTNDSAPSSIRRVDRQYEAVVGARNSDRNINAVVADAEARVKALALPAGVSVSFGGATEDQSEGFSGLLTAMALSVVFVYMVLASQFRSFSQPIVLMLAMPLSFIGAFLALVITGRELDILAMIGMLMLLGLVVKNSILLVDLTNTLRDGGMEKHAAIAQAGASRLRPILMTSLTIIFGVLPAAVGFGYGAALRQTLATVVIGGMITSTVLTLVLVPTAYSLLDSALSWLRQAQPAARQAQPAEQPVP